ncbi:hypothetical protein CIHG_01856 [Coccidioides immitis H538.4]|uniref:Zinc-ribbon domain-containing protein n=3 Tax=Coccidioides immitis TaxID=5501 RepID=A0A0J8U244_COCIT|nr:hypothetical protein CIRG_06177 [Coccidioides immitis RMSCC 2394]KMU80607.1 hypothetical protein CISG_08515 [Coccidioides immitis RMSCC 3703]KMU84070.1 hypothetical protein CIHG_01856 [Coccidioides immitis H538.4]
MATNSQLTINQGHSSCPACGAGISGDSKTCNSCGKTCPN